jgi:hypothetical protein
LRPSKYRTVTTAFLSLLASGFLLPQNSFAQGEEPPKAQKESADVQVRGKLQFMSRKVDFDGTDVGKEFDKRKYIAGHPDSPQRGIWSFDMLPRSMMSAPDDVVPARLTCSIFHLTNNGGPGVQVVIRAVSHNCPQTPPNLQQKGEWQWVSNLVDAREKTLKNKYEDDVAAYRAKKIDPGEAKPGTEGWKAANELAEKYGYYEFRIKNVIDSAETSIDLPAGLFRNAMKNSPETDANGKPKVSPVSILVKCESSGVMLGMAESDLHLVEKIAAKK